jgi:hypothetical protein
VPSLKFSRLRLYSLLALKKSKEVTSENSFTPILADPRVALALSLALYLENQPDEAARWRDRAIATIENMSRDGRRAGKILGAPSPTPVADFDRLTIEPDMKAVILLLLAERHPAGRDDYVAAAKRFNVRRRPPYHLLRLAIDRAAPAAR